MATRKSKIRKLARQSAAAWESAKDGADIDRDAGHGDRTSEIESLCDASESAWEDAVDAVGRRDYSAALEALRAARSADSEGGDSADADTAIELVEGWLAGTAS